jgi:hypothetical protein
VLAMPPLATLALAFRRRVIEELTSGAVEE